MNVDEAIQAATTMVKSLFGGVDHRLEEIEFTNDGDFEITISYREQYPARSPSDGPEPAFTNLQGRRAAIGVDASRLYKNVLLSKDGHLKAVWMRPIVVG